MEIMHAYALKEKWVALTSRLEKQFGEKPDLQTVIFLIGVQELGKGYVKFSREEKQDVMHIATCRLLSYWGYYELEGVDADGWPVWKRTGTIPRMSLQQQDQLLRQSVLEYFAEYGMPV
jgi:hypothetical protein